MDQALYDRLEKTAIRKGLATRRSALLLGIPQEITTELPVLDRPGDQLRSDLDHLIESPVGPNGEPALRTWLTNARRLALTPDAHSVFDEALATLPPVVAASAAVTSGASLTHPTEALDRFLRDCFPNTAELAQLLHYRLGSSFAGELPPLSVPSTQYSFAVVRLAEARGELAQLLDAVESVRPARRTEIVALRLELAL